MLFLNNFSFEIFIINSLISKMDHNLIPITKLKMNKDKWLNTLIQYEEDYTIKDVIEIMCQKTYQWILSKDDLTIITDYETFHKEFTDLIYDKYFV